MRSITEQYSLLLTIQGTSAYEEQDTIVDHVSV